MIWLAAILKPLADNPFLENSLHHFLNRSFCPLDAMLCDGFADKPTFCVNAHGGLIKINVPLPREQINNFLR